METDCAIPLSKVCDDLGVTPSVLRKIIADFPDILGIPSGAREAGVEPGDGEREPWLDLLEEGTERAQRAEEAATEAGDAPEAHGSAVTGGLPASLVPVIRRIVALRNDGASDEEVRRLMTDNPEASPEERLESKLDRLTRDLELSEKRRAEDRDRLLTALMRTHQEVRQLRTELITHASRRTRRKSFLGRLFGG
ncbi:MAG: hypothetical protein HPY55_12605 [Firmicutes bacterium]|nr:hypothetical protein [Bacillota bacterium]